MDRITAELVTIGNEVLSGRVVNSNAAWISEQLDLLGIVVQRHTTIPDDHEIIIETFSESMACAPIVIATGGLGPTLDDLTREAAAELFESPLEYDAELAEDLKKRYGNFDSIQDQANVSKKATLLPNILGTASGLLFHKGHSSLILLPGVPLEMQDLMKKEVIPILKKLFPIEKRDQKQIFHFAHLFESQVDPLLREYSKSHPQFKIGIYPSNGMLSVSGEGAPHLLNDFKLALLKAFGDHAFESKNGTIEYAIHERFIEKQWTLSLAESCTGGRVSSRLTVIPNASQYFKGSIVAYSNELKENLLSVSPEILTAHGAVSLECAKAMVEGLEKTIGTDFSLSITGIAGPSGGTELKPIGTFYVGIKKKGKPAEAFSFLAKGSREMIIDRASSLALSELYKISNSPYGQI